jgi:hypothetical protein
VQKNMAWEGKMTETQANYRKPKLDAGRNADRIYPVFELLEARLRQGFYIALQDGTWWLYNPDGEGHCSGNTIRELMVNLIFTDC